jgi:hypothetical protein
MTAASGTRITNGTGTTHCPYCCDEGWVLVGFSRGSADQMGPCPRCERGYAIEFPKSGKGPWGSEGYWRGRSTSGIEKTCTHGQRTDPDVRGASGRGPT